MQNEYKTVLVGDVSVGKTSIVKRLMMDSFSDNYKVTVGLQCNMKKVQAEDGSEVSLDIWDTAGDERYRSVFPQYYRNAQIALLVFDITNDESFKQIKYWHAEMQKFASSSLRVVALVGNKSDLAATRVVDFNESWHFAAKKGMAYFETSAKSGDNVKIVFQDCVNKALATAESQKQFEVKIQLKEMRQSSRKCC